MKSIIVTLDINDTNDVRCHLQTNDLPFDVVRDQLVRFIEALQWQVGNETKCPLFEQVDVAPRRRRR